MSSYSKHIYSLSHDRMQTHETALLDIIQCCDVRQCVVCKHLLVLRMLFHGVDVDDELADHVGDLLRRVLHVVDLNVPRHRLQERMV